MIFFLDTPFATYLLSGNTSRFSAFGPSFCRYHDNVANRFVFASIALFLACQAVWLPE